MLFDYKGFFLTIAALACMGLVCVLFVLAGSYFGENGFFAVLVLLALGLIGLMCIRIRREVS